MLQPILLPRSDLRSSLGDRTKSLLGGMAPFAFFEIGSIMEERMKRLYIGNFASVVTSDALQKLFGDRGFQVASVRIICDREGGRSRGFGFVEFGSSEDADRAIDALNGFEIEGRPLRIHEAHARDASDRHNYVPAQVSIKT